MLTTSVALILGEDTVWQARCRANLSSLGMARVYGFVGTDDMARRAKTWPIQFVVAQYLEDRASLEAAVAAVRGHRDLDVKFSPIVVLSKDAASANLKPYLRMGCDDIIGMPQPRGALASRMGQQLGRPLDFYETESYFGPDRRRLLAEEDDNGGRGAGGPVTHYVIQRDPKLGVQILSRETEAARAAKAG